MRKTEECPAFPALLDGNDAKGLIGTGGEWLFGDRPLTGCGDTGVAGVVEVDWNTPDYAMVIAVAR